eukprot:gene4809-3447_t
MASDQLRGQLEILNKKLHDRESSNQDEYAQLERKIELLLGEVESLRRKNDDLELTVASKAEEIVSLKGQRSSLEITLKAELRRKIRGQEAGDEGQRIKGRHRARWYPVYQWTEITHRLAGLEAAGARYLPAYKVEGASLEAAKGAARRVPTTSSSPRALTINSTPPGSMASL